MGNEEKKIFAGVLFYPNDPELAAIKKRTHKLNQDYNNLYEDQVEERKAIIHEILGEMGEGTSFSGPIRFHYGKHTKVGHHCFFNFNITIQDDGEVTIGNHCDFGPNVTIVTPVHPMIAEERVAMRTANGEEKRLCYAKPVHIGDNCWLCANCVILPGVTIGNNCVIGAGSVVTRDIPDNSFAAGNPARVIRTITEKDSMKYKPLILGDSQVIE